MVEIFVRGIERVVDLERAASFADIAGDENVAHQVCGVIVAADTGVLSDNAASLGAGGDEHSAVRPAAAGGCVAAVDGILQGRGSRRNGIAAETIVAHIEGRVGSVRTDAHSNIGSSTV